MRGSPGRTIRPIDPFAPSVSPKLAKGIRTMLVGPRVQEINFDFGSVLVHAQHFTAVSRLIVDHLHQKGIHCIVHPDMLLEDEAWAEYMPDYDAMYFQSWDVLDDEFGRATALHECVHAVCDFRRRVTAIRSEEGACIIAEAWYWLSSDEPVAFNYYSDTIWEIADRLRKRWLQTRAPVVLKASEINAARLEAARFGFQNGHYQHNGIVGT